MRTNVLCTSYRGEYDGHRVAVSEGADTGCSPLSRLCNANTGQVAHGTAGMYAAKYALAHPSRVRSLNLLDSPLDAGAASLLPLWILWLPGAPQMLAANAPIALTAMVLRR